MRQTLTLIVASSFNIVLAFLSQLYIFAVLGPGLETDALFAGLTMPQLVLIVVGDSLMHVLVPLLVGETEERFRHDSWGFFLLVGVFFAALTTVLYMTAPIWVGWIVPGFTAASQSLTVELTRIQLLGMTFSALTGVQWAVYHARQQFVWAEMVPFFCSLLAFCLLLWVLPRHGVVGAAWIGVLRSILQVVIMMPIMGAYVSPNIYGGGMKEFWRRVKPLLIGNLYFKTETLIDRFLLSMSGAGSLSIFYLGQQFYGASHNVINKSLVAPLVPKLSMFYKCNDSSSLKRIYRHGLIQISAVSVIIIILFLIAGKELLNILVGWGAFQDKNIVLLWFVMICLSGFFVGGVVGQITSSTFYSIGDTRTPTITSIISYTFFVPVKVVCFMAWGILGLACATSVHYLVNVLLQLHLLRKIL